jgi:hypothetical protein
LTSFIGRLTSFIGRMISCPDAITLDRLNALMAMASAGRAGCDGR